MEEQKGVQPDGHVRVVETKTTTQIYRLPPKQQAAMFSAIVSSDEHFWAKITAGFIMGFCVGAIVGVIFL